MGKYGETMEESVLFTQLSVPPKRHKARGDENAAAGTLNDPAHNNTVVHAGIEG